MRVASDGMRWVVGADDSAADVKTLEASARLSEVYAAQEVMKAAKEHAPEIVTIDFGAVIVGLALAAALAFGMGGREEAAKLIADWRARA